MTLVRRRSRLAAALATVAAALALATPAAAAVTDPVRGYVVVLADDVRDPDADRREVHAAFVRMLADRRCTVVRGTFEERERTAAEAIAALLPRTR